MHKLQTGTKYIQFDKVTPELEQEDTDFTKNHYKFTHSVDRLQAAAVDVCNMSTPHLFENTSPVFRAWCKDYIKLRTQVLSALHNFERFLKDEVQRQTWNEYLWAKDSDMAAFKILESPDDSDPPTVAF